MQRGAGFLLRSAWRAPSEPQGSTPQARRVPTRLSRRSNRSRPRSGSTQDPRLGVPGFTSSPRHPLGSEGAVGCPPHLFPLPPRKPLLLPDSWRKEYRFFNFRFAVISIMVVILFVASSFPTFVKRCVVCVIVSLSSTRVCAAEALSLRKRPPRSPPPSARSRAALRSTLRAGLYSSLKTMARWIAQRSMWVASEETSSHPDRETLLGRPTEATWAILSSLRSMPPNPLGLQQSHALGAASSSPDSPCDAA